MLNQPRTPPLRVLLREVLTGQLRIPRFQRRALVWGRDRRLELFDSLYRGYPIGSLLVWRTSQHELKCRDRVGLLLAPTPASSEPRVREYLLDGHQRVSILFTALGPGLYGRPKPELVDDDETDFRWPICFDLEADGDENPFVEAPLGDRARMRSTLIPLDALYDPYALSEHRGRLLVSGRPESEAYRLDDLAELFRAIEIPVVPVVTENVEDATRSFKRVNSGGVRMSEVDMVHALSWSPNFDLDESLSAATEALSEAGWPGAETQDVLTVVKLRQGQNIYRTSPEDVGEKIRARPTVIDEARIGLQVAVRALQECGIFGAGACPYSAQWILLGSVLDESLAIPGLVHGISMWLKATALGESFKGANATEFARARRHLLDFVHGGPALPLGLPREVEPIGKYDHRTARSRFLAWLLTDFGAQEDAARLLGRLGAEAVHQLVPGRRESPLTATIANRVVCGAEEMPMLRHRLNFGYLSESEQRRLYIPEDAARAWMMGDFERFLSLRMYAIEVAEAEMADSLGLRIGVRSYAFDQ